MTALAHKQAAFELRIRVDARGREAVSRRLSLRPTGDGWSLLAPSGEVVFRGFGLAGRRQCLEFAREHGVLAVLG
jgi:hypothetical protein